MRHYEVRDVMTADPVTVTLVAPIKDLAGILVKQQIGALPVLAARDWPVGLVTEADLLRKEQLQRDPDGQHSRHLTYRARRAIATAETAAEIMSRHPVTVRPGATAAEAARLMDRHGVRCLLVVDEGGKLLGVVSPRDLLRVFLRPDEEIRTEIVDDVLTGYLGTNPALVKVDVTDGVVRVAGELQRKSMLALLRPAIRAVDGVIDVEGRARLRDRRHLAGASPGAGRTANGTLAAGGAPADLRKQPLRPVHIFLHGYILHGPLPGPHRRKILTEPNGRWFPFQLPASRPPTRTRSWSSASATNSAATTAPGPRSSPGCVTSRRPGFGSCSRTASPPG